MFLLLDPLRQRLGRVVVKLSSHPTPGVLLRFERSDRDLALPAAVQMVREGLPQDACWWCSALDPAAPSGLGVANLAAGFFQGFPISSMKG